MHVADTILGTPGEGGTIALPFALLLLLEPLTAINLAVFLINSQRARALGVHFWFQLLAVTSHCF